MRCRPRAHALWMVVVAALTVAGCSSTQRRVASVTTSTTTTTSLPPSSVTTTTVQPTTTTARQVTTTTVRRTTTTAAAKPTSTTTTTAHVARELHGLAGAVIAVDPGHNGANGSHPSEINRQVDAGGFKKACDTTGTATNAGLTEVAYTFDVATRLAAVLRAAGATVVLTRSNNSGVGPCVDERA